MHVCMHCTALAHLCLCTATATPACFTMQAYGRLRAALDDLQWKGLMHEAQGEIEAVQSRVAGLKARMIELRGLLHTEGKEADQMR